MSDVITLLGTNDDFHSLIPCKQPLVSSYNGRVNGASRDEKEERKRSASRVFFGVVVEKSKRKERRRCQDR